jgi:hypothetical protein
LIGDGEKCLIKNKKINRNYKRLWYNIKQLKELAKYGI